MKIPGGRFAFWIIATIVMIVFSAMSSTVNGVTKRPGGFEGGNIINGRCPDGSRPDANGKCRVTL